MGDWAQKLDQAKSRLVYGKDFEGTPEKLSDLDRNECCYEPVIVRGKIIQVSATEISASWVWVRFYLFDQTGTMLVKMAVQNEARRSILKHLREGTFVIVQGCYVFDFSEGDCIIDSVSGIREYYNIISGQKH